ncbi:hypothetical protein [Actinophytocola sp. NPDC049390]|uniref:hypothetical protein n=1 Tax=Actinophytocola sp. NPDC049390 TaxID=3363894 RepID=UPI00379C7C41
MTAAVPVPARHQDPPRADTSTGHRLAWVLALSAFIYASYRAYYALGGTAGMFGEPVSDAEFRAINAVGAAIILVAAILPPVAVRTRLRRALPALGWLAAVGCCTHALVNITLRVFSLTGVHPTVLPSDVWRSYDRHASDLQDLLLNEPWFLAEGLLWAALGLVFVAASRRRAWVLSAAAACLALSVVGVLSGLDVIGSFRVG